MSDDRIAHSLNGRAAEARLIGERNRFLELRRRIIEQFPDVDEQTLADTLEGATNLREALAILVRSALDDEHLAKMLKERLATLRTRLARLENNAFNKRRLACETMETARVRKLVEADFTAFLRDGPPSVEIGDESKLPSEYLIPQPPRPDKRGILEALKGGAQVPGAMLCMPGPSLSIRSV